MVDGDKMVDYIMHDPHSSLYVMGNICGSRML